MQVEENKPIHDFPKDFLWGTAMSGHQTEGNNTNSDWWAWEHRDAQLRAKEPEWKRIWPKEPSDVACDSYNRYEEDFDLCLKLNNKAVRIGVEWSRIEPSEGVFDEQEITHYKKVLKAAKDRGLIVHLTIWHFSLPNWVALKGGWTNKQIITWFARYSKKCAQAFDEFVDVYLTINEPQVYALQGYIVGLWPPNQRNFINSLICQIYTWRGHNAAYKSIKTVSSKPVGIVKNIVNYQTSEKVYLLKPIDILIAKTLYWLNCEFYLDRVVKCCDLIGLNFYFTNEIRNLALRNPNTTVSDMHWWIYPQGIFPVLLRLKKYNLPIYITENGCADERDHIRKDFLEQTLIYISKAIKDGAPIKGYFHWSLIDNYEWHHGYWPKFGLVEIDRKNNLQRKPRPSFYFYADECYHL